MSEENLTLEVRGMHREGCAESVQNALVRLEGVRDAVADLEAGQAAVRYDSERSCCRAAASPCDAGGTASMVAEVPYSPDTRS